MTHALINIAETPLYGQLWLLEKRAAATVAVTAERPLVDTPPPAWYCSATHVSGTLRLRSGRTDLLSFVRRGSSATVLEIGQFRVPCGLGSEHGVDDGEQLTDAGDEGHFFRFAGGAETLVEGLD